MLYSIAVYAATFGVSLFGIHRYQKNMDRKDRENAHIRMLIRMENILWILLILLPPVLVAAFRADTVGTDCRSYLRIFNAIKRYDLKTYIQKKDHIMYGVEYGYWFICRIAYKLNGGFVLANFISEFLIIFFMWRGFIWFHKKFGISMALGMFLFYMLQYAYGLNAIRFSIGAAICFYAIRFLLEKRVLLYVLVCLLGASFHTILFIAILFYAVNIFNNKIMKKSALAVMLVAFFLVIFEMDELLRLVQRLTFLRKYFEFYEINEQTGYGWGIWLVVMPLFLPLIVFWERIMLKSEKLQVLCILSMLYIPFRFLGYYNQWMSRPLRLSELYLCAMIPCLLCAVDNKTNKRILETYYICVALFLYIYNYVILNYSTTYPFEWIS